MKSLYEIEEGLTSLFSDIIAQGGEITPEQEKQLEILEEAFSDKMEAYAKVRQQILRNNESLKAEIERMQELMNTNKKVIENLQERMLNALVKFGQEKNGVYSLSTPLFKFSTRRYTSKHYDEEKLIEKFYKLEVVLDKEAVKKAVENGEKVDGYTEEQKYSLIIK